jgi:LemA protein
MIELYIGLILVIVIIIYAILKYNELKYFQIQVDKKWGRINIILKKRYDLIPQLVEIVKGYAKHEKDTLVDVAKLRSEWQNTDSQKTQTTIASEIETNLAKIAIVVENYPKLKADKSFSKLSKELVITENQLAKHRLNYNESVARYNVRVNMFPRLIFAKLFKFKEKGFFQFEENED